MRAAVFASRVRVPRLVAEGYEHRATTTLCTAVGDHAKTKGIKRVARMSGARLLIRVHIASDRLHIASHCLTSPRIASHRPTSPPSSHSPHSRLCVRKRLWLVERKHSLSRSFAKHIHNILRLTRVHFSLHHLPFSACSACTLLLGIVASIVGSIVGSIVPSIVPSIVASLERCNGERRAPLPPLPSTTCVLCSVHFSLSLSHSTLVRRTEEALVSKSRFSSSSDPRSLTPPPTPSPTVAAPPLSAHGHHQFRQRI